MANSLPIKSTYPERSSKLLLGESYNLFLVQSIKDLIAEANKSNPNLSPFLYLFYELMQSKIDPPFETIWVCSALSFRGFKPTKDDLLDRVLSIKKLFQLVSCYSASCSPYKSIALLGPVVSEVHKLVKELFVGDDLGDKRMKKVVKEVKFLVGAVLRYVSLCCSSKDFSEGISDSDLVVPLADLVSVWIDGKEEDLLKLFLPLVSDDVLRGVKEGGLSVNLLAGIVIAEVFLLKLCLDVRAGNHGPELEKELTNWAVGSLTGCQSFYFFDTIMSLLLEPTLPVTSLLSFEDETFLRTVLYDALLLPEFSFLTKEAIRLPADKVRSLLLKRLIVACQAAEFFRKCRDQKRGILHNASFSNSRFSFQIIKHVTDQIGVDQEGSKFKGSSPKALLRWLLGLENQGVKLFDDSISKYRAKSVLNDTKTSFEKYAFGPENSTVDTEFLFYIDNEGEEGNKYEDNEEINESMSAAFVAAARTMQLREDGERKRKGEGTTGKNKRSKFFQHDLLDKSDSTDDGTSSASNDDSSSESEIDNPVSNEDA